MALRVMLTEKKPVRLLSLKELLFCSQCVNKLPCIVLKDRRLVIAILQLLQYAKTFKVEYSISFAKVSTKSIATDPMNSNFFTRAQLCSYHRIVFVGDVFI